MEACLLASYTLLVDNESICNVLDQFESSARQIQSGISKHSTIDSGRDFLRALDHANKKGWIEYDDPDASHFTSDLLDKMLHYASPVNGNVRTIIPDKLLVFCEPADLRLPDDRLWEDSNINGRTVRSFSARYYAELFRDLQVSLVAQLDDGALDAGAAFEAVGVAFEEGLLPPSQPAAALRAHDRLFTLARAAEGPIALQCSAASVAAAGTLVSAYLMEQAGFDAGEAKAWLQLMCPELIPEG
jgi:hypothetical protein